jgi:hypothetical protein
MRDIAHDCRENVVVDGVCAIGIVDPQDDCVRILIDA